MVQPTRRVFAAIVPPPACADVPGMAAHLVAATEGHPAFQMRISGAGSFHARRGSTLWMAARGATDHDETSLRALLMAVETFPLAIPAPPRAP